MDNPFETIIASLASIDQKILKLQEQYKDGGLGPEDYISGREAADYLKITIGALYTYCSTKRILYYKRFGKLYFLKSELNEYIKKSQIHTNEVEARRKRRYGGNKEKLQNNDN